MVFMNRNFSFIALTGLVTVTLLVSASALTSFGTASAQDGQCSRTVAEGEAIGSIADDIGVSVKVIVDLNPDIEDIDFVKLGDNLFVPCSETVEPLATPTPTSTPPVDVVVEEPTVTPTALPSEAELDQLYVCVYVIVPDDAWQRITDSLGITDDALAEANPRVNPEVLQNEQTLRYESPCREQPARTATTSATSTPIATTAPTATALPTTPPTETPVPATTAPAPTTTATPRPVIADEGASAAVSSEPPPTQVPASAITDRTEDGSEVEGTRTEPGALDTALAGDDSDPTGTTNGSGLSRWLFAAAALIVLGGIAFTLTRTRPVAVRSPTPSQPFSTRPATAEPGQVRPMTAQPSPSQPSRLPSSGAATPKPIHESARPASDAELRPAETKRTAALPIAADDTLVLGKPSRGASSKVDYGPVVGMFVPSQIADQGQLGELRFRAASLQGHQHRFEFEPRQDSYALGVARDGEWLLVAVADGLGSAQFSHFGSRMAADSATRLLANQLSGADAPNFIDLTLAVEQQLVQAYPETSVTTTLVVAAVNSRTGLAHLGRIGDSEALVMRSGAWTSVFGEDTEASDLSAATAALPGDAGRTETAAVQLDFQSPLLIATDGVAKPIEAAPSDVGGAFSQQLQVPPSLASFVRLIGFDRKGFTDDRTAVAIWWTGNVTPQSQAIDPTHGDTVSTTRPPAPPTH